MSRIEWTEKTWNPITGCTKVSSGCKNCYAEKMAGRLKAMGVVGYENGFELTLQPGRLGDPFLTTKPSVFFLCSMSDLFHEAVPDDYIGRVMDTISMAKRHDFQVLTKRADRMVKYFKTRTVPSNLWLGVSVENQGDGLPRIEQLRMIYHAQTRFISCEPLLGDLQGVDLSGIDWVIVGGESGPGARPMKPAWARIVRDAAVKQGALFFFKQWGAWGPDGKRRSKKANGRELDGEIWDEKPFA